MERTDRVELSTRGVDNDISYATDAFREWHLSNAFDLEAFKREFEVIRVEETMQDGLSSAVFDVKGIDAPLANALRRNMIARVRTMALDQVTLRENSSEIPDEILVHRIGLVPLRAPPNQFADMAGENDKFDVQNSLKFTLDVTCTDEASSRVYSRDIKWQPKDAEHREMFREKDIGPVHDDILIAQLAPGQRIDLDAMAVLGRGETHAKWSPVATAFYRILPVVEIVKPIRGSDAKRLRDLCPLKVFDIEDGEAVVQNARACSVCRECIREEHFGDAIKLSRNKRHFIFSIESTGAYLARDIFREALRELQSTLLGVRKAHDKYLADLEAK